MKESDWANTMNLPLPSNEKLSELKKASCSESNFAVQLVRELFSDDELVNKNVHGRKGKQALDRERMLQVRNAYFRFYPCESGQEEKAKGSKCAEGRNAFLRQKNKVSK